MQGFIDQRANSLTGLLVLGASGMQNGRSERVDTRDWSRSREKYGLTPIFSGGKTGVVQSINEETGLISVKADDGDSYSVPPLGFGDFELEPGDEVGVGPDIHGTWHAVASIWSATEFIPKNSQSKGSKLKIGGQSVELSDTCAAAVNDIRANKRDRRVRYLMIRNRQTRSSRAWGAMPHNRR